MRLIVVCYQVISSDAARRSLFHAHHRIERRQDPVAEKLNHSCSFLADRTYGRLLVQCCVRRRRRRLLRYVLWLNGAS